MSSPSSSAGSGKRKRTNTNTSTLLKATAKSSTADLLQPSSRDASGEDAEDSAAAVATGSSGGGTRHKKTSSAVDSGNHTQPPTKRPRTRSTTSNAAADKNTTTPNGGPADVAMEDPGEPSDSTEASTDIARRTKPKRTATASSSNNKDSNGDLSVSGIKHSMPPPLKHGQAGRVLKNPEGGYTTNQPPVGRPVRVYADGVFDLFHLGHMRQLEQAKTAFPDTYLIVGVTGDEETHARKGLTVLSGAERAETVGHCKWVDEVVPNCPWIVTPEFLEEHAIDYVAHDDLPYGAAEGDDIYAPIKEQGKFLVTERTEGVSTTGIITKIVRDYEKYIARQLKRGTSRQELNISWLKKNEMDLKRHVNELRDNIRNNWTTTGSELTKELKHLWQSRPGSPARSLSRSSSRAGASGLRSSGVTSPTVLGHLAHLEVPRQGGGAANDFATGYSLGLIGGVRSWMTRSRVSLQSQPPSSSSSDDDTSNNGNKSPVEDKPARGRTGRTSLEV